MSNQDIFKVIRNIIKCLAPKQRGEKLALVFRREAQDGNLNLLYRSIGEIERGCQFLSVEWRVCVSEFFKATFLLHKKNDPGESFRHLCLGVESFNVKIFRPDSGNWMLPLVRVFCLYLRVYAYNSYNFRKRNKLELDDTEQDELSRATNLLYSINRIAVAQKTDDPRHSKKPVAMHLGNQLFKIYFKLRNLTATKQLILNTETIISKVGFRNFCMSDRVTWKYFLGIIRMFDDYQDFEASSRDLTFALTHCPQKCRKQKRLILYKLICVNLMLGKVPSVRLLERYQLKEFVGIVNAYKTGNLSLFDQNLNRWYGFFFRQGTYIILNQTRLCVTRNFYRKAITYMYQYERDPKKKTRIKFDVLNKVYNRVMEGEKKTLDETECILSALIYKGYLLGYISNEKRTLVIAQNLKKAFPSILEQYQKYKRKFN